MVYATLHEPCGVEKAERKELNIKHNRKRIVMFGDFFEVNGVKNRHRNRQERQEHSPRVAERERVGELHGDEKHAYRRDENAEQGLTADAFADSQESENGREEWAGAQQGFSNGGRREELVGVGLSEVVEERLQEACEEEKGYVAFGEGVEGKL